MTLHEDEIARRIHFDAESLLPLRLEIFESSGKRPVAYASLTHYAPMNSSSVQGESPMVPTRIVMGQLDPPVELEINADLATHRPMTRDEIYDRVFDFDAILRSMGIPEDVVEKHGFDDE